MRYNLITLLGILFLFSCTKEKSFEVGPLATGSLQNLAGDCLPKLVSGNYIAGTALKDSNFIEVTLDVSQAGSYNIFTDTINGYSFRGQGRVSATGTNTIRLTGTGKPLAEGTDNFSVFFDSTTCAVQVTVLPSGSTPPTPPAAGIYFPLTADSWWSYNVATDTFKVVVNGTATLVGKTYQRFIVSDGQTPLDTAYYRKDNATGFYYQYADTAGFGDFGIVFPQAGLDVLFLKDALTNGAIYNSDHPATVLGTTATIRVRSIVRDANASLTVNGVNFTNVYKIEQVFQVGVGGSFQDISQSVFYYYAKDIGLIKVDDTVNTQDIRHWKVN